MNKTDQLINALAESAETAKRSNSPFGIFLHWIACSLAYEIIMVLIFGLRPDLPQRLNSNTYITELGILAAIVITSGLSAVHLSFPDLHQRKWLVYLPIIPFISFAVFLYSMWLHEVPVVSNEPPHGIECLLCVTAFSAFSAIAIMWFLKKQATTHYYASGAVAFLASSSLGAFAFGLCEPIDSVAHLVIWHYLPMLGFMALGAAFGRKFLRW